ESRIRNKSAEPGCRILSHFVAPGKKLGEDSSVKRFTLLFLFVVASPALAQREYGFNNTKASGQPYLKPQESLARMKIADGFEIRLAAAEPTIVNPIAFTIDEKGRIWVVESFEYPKRTPKGKMPRDRIKILESTKGDGVFDKVILFAE